MNVGPKHQQFGHSKLLSRNCFKLETQVRTSNQIKVLSNQCNQMLNKM